MANVKSQISNVRWILPFAALLLLAAAFRISVAHWLPNDAPDDGRVYAQMARNVLEQHVYSHDSEPPFNSSLIRLPGYPLFLASIYSVFGHTNNGAVRIIQALVDTATCGLIGVLAFYWQPDEKKKRVTALAALTLAVVCPFTTIYTATILTEVLTNFLLVALLIAATLAMRKLTTDDTEEDRKQKRTGAVAWWCVVGLIGGVAVMMRPDAGLFLAAVGVTLVITNIWSAVAIPIYRERYRFGSTGNADDQRNPKRRRRFALPAHSKVFVARVLISGATLSVAFILVLTPWTIRNWYVFHLFQPLAPAHAEMPGEFVPRGYLLWVRSWLDDEKYVAQFLWPLEVEPIDVDELPDSAFDSPEEKKRIATLFEKYNNPDESQSSETNQSARELSTGPTPTPSPNRSTESTKPNQTASPTPDENDEKDESEDSADQEESNVELTPDVDAGFMKIARERIARHPFRHYVWLPIKRARTMWFDTHSQYWPFEGELLPLDDLDYDIHQQFWLPLFAALTAVYTLLGLAGAWVLFRARNFEARRWLLLVVLAIGLRVMLFASLENPEPRYFVEFFPILSVLGGLFMARILTRGRVKQAP
jgi:hypothetical protein